MEEEDVFEEESLADSDDSFADDFEADDNAEREGDAGGDEDERVLIPIIRHHTSYHTLI